MFMELLGGVSRYCLVAGSRVLKARNTSLRTSRTTGVSSTTAHYISVRTHRTDFSTSSCNNTQQAVKLVYSVFEPPAVDEKTKSGVKHAPVVFLHGLFGSRKNFESIAKACSKKLCRQIITVDARNHGDSPHHSEMNYLSMSADMTALLRDELKLDRVIVMGHSMGGKTAMVLALSQPELVEKLIVEDMSPGVSLSSGFPAYIRAMSSVVFDQSLSSLALVRRSVGEQIKDTFPDKPLRDFILTNIDQRQGKYCWRINLDAVEKHLEDILGFPQFSTTYGGPTLFLGGDKSLMISDAYYPEIYRLFPSSVIQHIQGAGHWVHSEKPQEFMTAIINFIQN